MANTFNWKRKKIISVQPNRKLFSIWFISLVCIALGVATTPYLSVISLLLFFAALLFFQTEEIFALLFGLLPFANIFKVSTDSMSLFTICEIGAVIYLILLKKRLKVSQFLMLMVLTIYLVISSLSNLNFFVIVKVIVGFLLIGFAISTFTQYGLRQSARILSFSTIAMLLLSTNQRYLSYVEKYFTDLNYYIDATGHATDMLRVSGFFGDPNYCAVLIIFVLSLLGVLYYYKAIGAEFWLHTAFLVPLGFLTYSKSYFLCIALFVIMLILFVLFPRHKCWALISLVGIGVVVWLVANGKIEAINMILARFTQGNLTTGRTALNKIYLQYIYDNTKVLFFGDGISADRFSGASNNVHCLYIEILYKLGIIGTGLYCGTLAATLSKAKKQVERHFVNYLPLAFFLLMFTFLAGVVNYALPFYIMIVALTFNYASLASDKNGEVQYDRQRKVYRMSGLR